MHRLHCLGVCLTLLGGCVGPGDPAALAEWQAKKQWLSQSTQGCDSMLPIYCIETHAP